MEPVAVVLAVVLGVAAGVSSGLFGIGGGTIVVPGLLFLVPGTTFFAAKAASLLAMAIGGVTGILRHHRSGNVDFRLGLALGAGGVVAAVASVFLVERIAEGTVQAAFGVFLVLVGLRLFLPIVPRSPDGRGVRALPVALLVGVGAGLLGGAFGVGGGILMVPVLVFAGVGMHAAVATSLVAVVLVGGAASAAHLVVDAPRYGPALVLLGLPIAAGALAGARWGASLAARLPADRLRLAFGVFLVLVGGWTAFDALG